MTRITFQSSVLVSAALLTACAPTQQIALAGEGYGVANVEDPKQYECEAVAVLQGDSFSEATTQENALAGFTLISRTLSKRPIMAMEERHGKMPHRNSCFT